ncbi:polysaccharide lyase family protein [Lactiplantibacillus pentosus]|uniref:polysaccharide lyase family protein n=1 Tax=Lactiplantibacillus pentosus TaxID=1589 RepID=UPI000B53C94E|nr:polysaccharide lyase family protein [Lactiplantibacillus pentosus]ASG79903.1 rhamnogalacturonate lyase [Lactiplantibacillus pentosus]
MLKLETNEMTAVITNNRLNLSLTKEGMVQSLKIDGQELLNNLTGEPGDPDKDHSFYLDYHMNGKTVNMKPVRMEVVEDSPEAAHVVYIDDQSDLGLAYHLIVRGDDTAIYGYVEAWSNTDHSFKVNELRTVYRLDHELFNIGYNAERIGHQPTSAHMMSGDKLQDETYVMADGSFYSNSKIYSKYDYAGYLSENPFWGQYGDKYGLWFIPADRSYFPSGPLNQDLLLHYDGLILNYMTAVHFGTGDIEINPGWHKLYGPWCVLVTNDTHPLPSVRKRVRQEQAAWPYQWVKDDNYPLSLATVTGQVTVGHQISDYPFEVVLAQPSQDGTFMHQREDYIYYAETDKHGRFEINNVRPGDYTVYAYAKGGTIVGMPHWDGAAVKTGHCDLGEYDIPDDDRQVIWQIGQSTHTTEGFKFSDQLRNHIWKDLVPNNLVYHIGRQTSDDWYYLQNDGGVWKIVFNGRLLNTNKDAYLSIAFAGVTKKVMTEPRGTRVEVDLNKQMLVTHYYERNDSAGYRSALRGGNYELLTVTITADQLKSGVNELAIKTDGYLLYDTLKLEQDRDENA